MAILAVGLSYRDAPVELRERFAIPEAHLEAALDRLSGYVSGGIILSTCNRTEIYADVGHRGSGLRALTRFVTDYSGLAEGDLGGHLHHHWQEQAARHLFSVAAGLDSMIIGEGQILGQVRGAFESCTRYRPVGSVLTRLFDRALVVGKRARTETAIARSAVSVSQAAVELARARLGQFDRATVLVIGAGKMGGLRARALRERGASQILVANRTAARAGLIAAELGGQVCEFARLLEGVEQADIVISSTASDDYVITADQLAPILARRRAKPLVIVDIAVPRDVDPEVASLGGVHLFNVDDLRGVCATNLDARRRETDKIELIIEEEVSRFIQWWQERELAPTISALVQRAEAIRKDELNRALARLGTLSERDANTINALTVAIVNKMLHAPIVQLKERGAGLDGKHYLHAVRELFDLPAVEAAAD